jgi:RsiW-degrading membrane proteinase PrsW (M82 family)
VVAVDAATLTALIIFVSIAPAVFLLWFFYRIDKWKREPLLLILGVFAGGCVVARIVYAIAYQDLTLFISSLYAGVADLPAWLHASALISLLGQPLLWAVVGLTVYRRKEFNEPIDGIIYGAAAGLGFALVQNVILFSTVLTTATAAGGAFVNVYNVNIATQVFLPTVLFTVPMQALFTAISCYCLGIAKFSSRGRGRYFTMVAGLGVAVLMQIGWAGTLIVNFPAFQDPYGLTLFYFDTVCFAVASWVLVTGRIDAALDKSPYNPSRRGARPTTSLVSRIISAPNPVRRLHGSLSRFCPHCGTRITGAMYFCPKCGTLTRSDSD